MKLWSFAIMTVAVSLAGGGATIFANEKIPFESALDDANVTLSSMKDGNSQSLMLGNGDLYGIVWEAKGSLYMRITKNDIWDARVDTSKDGPLPKVDLATGKVTGSRGAQHSYKLPYPHPRCAAAIRFGAVKAGSGVNWQCIRAAAKHDFSVAPGKTGAVMQVGGDKGASTGYRAALGDAVPAASALHFTLKGSSTASYYVNVYDKAGKNILATGWKKSPTVAEEIEITFPAQAVGMLELYTMTAGGKISENHVDAIYLSTAGGKRKIPLPEKKAAGAGGMLDLRRAVATTNSLAPTKVRVLSDRNVVLIRTAQKISLEPVTAKTIPAAQTGKSGEVSWLHQKLSGDANGDWAGMEYALALASKGHLKVVSLVTSYDIKKGNVREAAITLAEDTIREKESRLIAQHEGAWRQFWSRSGVALADKDYQRWWYRMLYFAKTTAKPGAAPVGLMPPLATDATPWHADLHHNYNVWQGVWPLPGANQAELTDPWTSYVHDMMPRFKWLAKETYGIDGVCFPISSFLHEPDPAVCKSKYKRQVHQNPWGLTIGMVGMTIQSMWQRHLCAPDRKYMKAKIYPTLKEGAKFYVSFMQKCKQDDKGKVLLGPSYSPEHGPMGIYNCPFDIAYVQYTFDAFIRAATELAVDKDLAEECRKYKALLGSYPTATDKGGKPVIVDWKGCKYKQVAQHNIEVPASPVFPCDQVTWFSPESEKELFRRTIKVTQRTGANSHVMFNIAKARLSMAEAVSDAKGS